MKFAEDPSGLVWFKEWLQYGDFDWNHGNIGKNEKHGITDSEIEAIFCNTVVFVGKIIEPKSNETRWLLLGMFDHKEYIIIVTPREERLRIISCRRARKDERRFYERFSN